MAATPAVHFAPAIRDAGAPTSRKIAHSRDAGAPASRKSAHSSNSGTPTTRRIVRNSSLKIHGNVPVGLLNFRGGRAMRVCRAAAVSVEPTAVPRPAQRSVYEITTFTTWLMKQEQAGVIDGELTIVLSSISLACKQIASLVKRAGISNLTGLQGSANVQGEQQKKLDVVSNEIFSSCLRSCGRTGIIAFMEEKQNTLSVELEQLVLKSLGILNPDALAVTGILPACAS